MKDFPLQFLWIIVPLVIWTLIWKGMALWTAARRGEKGWFIAFLVVNTVGALEIIYLLVIAPQRPSAPPATAPKR